MKLQEIADLLEATYLWGEDKKDLEIETAGAGDLMSDILSMSKPHILLLTGQVNPQVVRTALMMDIKCVIFVRGKKIPAETIELGKQFDIVLLSTAKKMFASCGILYSNGIKGID